MNIDISTKLLDEAQSPVFAKQAVIGREVSPSIHFLLWCKTSFPFSPIEDSNNHLLELCKDFTYWVQNRIGFAVPVKIIDFDLEFFKAKVSAVAHDEEGWILIKEIYQSEDEADR